MVIATHGKFSEGLKDAIDVIVGMTEGIETVVLKKGQDIDQFDLSCGNVERADTGDGVLVWWICHQPAHITSPFWRSITCLKKARSICDRRG